MNPGMIFDACVRGLARSTGEAEQTLLRDDDHLLGRFGEAAWLECQSGFVPHFSLRPDADRLFVVVQGAAWIVMRDLRQGSPSRNVTQVVRLDRQPHALALVPFGVACAVRAAEGGYAALLVLSTRARGDGAPEQTFAGEDPRIAFDWSQVGNEAQARRDR